MHSDLFTYRESYPHKPGHRGVSTSRAAAEAISARASELEQKVIDALIDKGAMTFWEIASVTGLPFDTAQPCVSRLRARGLVVDSGVRKLNPKGRNVIAWRVK